MGRSSRVATTITAPANTDLLPSNTLVLTYKNTNTQMQIKSTKPWNPMSIKIQT